MFMYTAQHLLNNPHPVSATPHTPVDRRESNTGPLAKKPSLKGFLMKFKASAEEKQPVQKSNGLLSMDKDTIAEVEDKLSRAREIQVIYL